MMRIISICGFVCGLIYGVIWMAFIHPNVPSLPSFLIWFVGILLISVIIVMVYDIKGWTDMKVSDLYARKQSGDDN